MNENPVIAFFKKYEIQLLSVVFYSVLLSYAYHFVQLKGNAYPCYNDEYAYFLDIKNFVVNNSLATPINLDGNLSKVGSFGSHGPGSTLINGLVAKITGFGNQTLFYINFFIALLSFGLVFLIKELTLTQKLKINILISTYFINYFFAFTYMQESIQLLFAVLSCWLLIKIYHPEQKNQNRYIAYFILLICVAASVRLNWLVCLFALFPYFEAKKQRLQFVLFFFGVILYGLLFQSLFVAPYGPGFLSQFTASLKSAPLSQSIGLFHDHFISNWKNYFFDWFYNAYSFISKYLLAILCIIISIKAWSTKNKLAQAISIIGIACLSFLFFFYDAFDYRELRHLATLICFFGFALVMFHSPKLQYWVLALQLFFFPVLHNTMKERGQEYKNAYANYMNNPDAINSFKKLEILILDQKVTTSYLTPDFLNHHDIRMTILPLRNVAKAEMRYTTDLTGNVMNPNNPVDYVISKNEMALPYQLIYKDDYFCLYKTNR